MNETINGNFDDLLYDANYTLIKQDPIIDINYRLEFIDKYIIINTITLEKFNKIEKFTLGRNIINLLFSKDDESIDQFIKDIVKKTNISEKRIKQIYLCLIYTNEFILSPDENDMMMIIDHIYNTFKMDYYLKEGELINQPLTTTIYIDVNTLVSDLTYLPSKEDFFEKDDYSNIILYYLCQIINENIISNKYFFIINDNKNDGFTVYNQGRVIYDKNAKNRYTRTPKIYVTPSSVSIKNRTDVDQEDINLDHQNKDVITKLKVQMTGFPISCIFHHIDTKLRKFNAKFLYGDEILNVIYYEEASNPNQKINLEFNLIFNNRLESCQLLIIPENYYLLIRPLFSEIIEENNEIYTPMLGIFVNEDVKIFNNHKIVTYNGGSLFDMLAFFDVASITAQKTRFYKKDFATFLYNNREKRMDPINSVNDLMIMFGDYLNNPLIETKEIKFDTNDIFNFINQYFDINLKIHQLNLMMMSQHIPIIEQRLNEIRKQLSSNSYDAPKFLENNHISQYQRLLHSIIEIHALEKDIIGKQSWSLPKDYTKIQKNNVSLIYSNSKYYLICKIDDKTGFLSSV